MKYLLTLAALLFAFSAMANIDAPVLTFQQKVEIVVEAKKNPAILELKLEQNGYVIAISAIVDKDTTRDQAKGMAHDLVVLTKALSLDDKPKDDKTIGKGLYDYNIGINRVDGILLLTAKKPAKKKKINFDLPVEMPAPVQIKPWTLEDANPR